MERYKENIDNITQELSIMLKGGRPTTIALPPDFPDNEIKQLTTYCNKFIVHFNDVSDFSFRLAGGDLETPSPAGKSKILQSIKSIHSSLSHLKLKTKKIARGDYNQEVNLMGHFSETFNSMARQLRESKTLLEQKIEERTRQLLIAKEKAEECDRLKSAFLANMSHEIRTPMNGILGFTQLMRKPDITVHQKQEYLDIIERSGRRMLSIINDIISISKIESGAVDLNIRSFNINEQQERLYSFFKPDVDDKNLELSFKSPLPTENSLIKADKNKFISIYSNLIKNAIKYTQKGSIKCGYNVKDSFIEFYVQDTGIGIEHERMDIIFERFMQADIEDKMARQGAGLGLSISKAYVEILGGKIWAESKVGSGSTFYFTLPFISQPSIKEDPSSNIDNIILNGHFKDLKILIVEDDDTSALLLTLMIESLNCKILQAKNGVEALELCQNNEDIDLVLMDIRMPVMDGYEATRKIRLFNKKVVIIAQTAHAFSKDTAKALEAGCNEHISKPIIKNELFSIIKHYFGNRSKTKVKDKRHEYQSED